MGAQGDNLKKIADAIRSKDGTTATIPAKTFPDRIKAIETGTDTSDATAAASDLLTGKTAYGSAGKLTGSMANRGAVAQTLSTNGAAYTIPGGYHNGSGKVTANITNLTAANIRSGATVGGVAGTFSRDGTATASDIANGKIAYVNGNKVTGIINTVNPNGGISGTTTISAITDTDILLSTYTVDSQGTHPQALLRENASISSSFPLTTFGNATAEDVAVGKTFTSADGININGTGSMQMAFVSNASNLYVEFWDTKLELSFSFDISTLVAGAINWGIRFNDGHSVEWGDVLILYPNGRGICPSPLFGYPEEEFIWSINGPMTIECNFYNLGSIYIDRTNYRTSDMLLVI